MWWLLVSGPSAAQEPLGPARGEAPTPPAPGAVTLRVAVHRAAGTVHQIAADGAAGQCTVVAQALHCPALGPVTFRWGPGGPWELVGDTVLLPGAEGEAVLWAAGREQDHQRLLPDVVRPEVVRELFVATSADGPHSDGGSETTWSKEDAPSSASGLRAAAAPSASMFSALLDLADHPHPLIRRELPDALLPYLRHTASDPFPADAPAVVPAELVARLARDEDLVVRRRLASRLRDLQAPGEPLAEEATDALLTLAADPRSGVKKAALASLAVRARGGGVPALETWDTALERVTTPGPPGRAAANTLAALAKQLEPGPEVDPALAIERTAVAQLERVWTVWRAWRAHVPFDPVLAERLLRETEGVSPELVSTWAESDPGGLLLLLQRWEPRPPHSDRYAIVARAAAASGDPALRTLAADTLSPEAVPPAPE